MNYTHGVLNLFAPNQFRNSPHRELADVVGFPDDFLAKQILNPHSKFASPHIEKYFD